MSGGSASVETMPAPSLGPKRAIGVFLGYFAAQIATGIVVGVLVGVGCVLTQQSGAEGVAGARRCSRLRLRLAVRKQDEPATRQILLRARAIPREPLPDQPAVAETGGPCPACGDPVAAGSTSAPAVGSR